MLRWTPYRSAVNGKRFVETSLVGKASLLELLACGSVFIIAARLCQKDLSSFHFDDAGMFYRYAWNLRHGYGMAWNAGEKPVFGLTSLPWALLVLVGSFFSADPVHIVVVLSFLAGIFALAAIAWFASRRATSPLFSRFGFVFPLISLPLLLHPWFEVSLGNGMETMLALGALAVFLECFRRFAQTPTPSRTLFAALAGTLCVLTRPELLLSVLLVAITTNLLLMEANSRRAFAGFCALLGLLIALELFFNRVYFGTPVPLSFYIKSFGTYYDGYRLYINGLGYNSMFFSIAAPLLFALALLAGKRHVKLLTVYLLPAIATMLYLAEVNQIMGWRGRYYIPLLALLFVPVLTLADEAMSTGRMPGWSRQRLLAVSAAFLLASPVSERIYGPLGHALAASRRIYSVPQFQHTAAGELPFMEWSESCRYFLAFAADLPRNTVISASEVGVLGATFPQMKIVDSAGLNDTNFALHGFSNDLFFAQNPDLIWLPHPDYTRLYGTLSADPRLLERYDFYSGVFTHGVALRRDSPHYAKMKAALELVFNQAYPGYALEAYKVKRVTWDPHKTRAGTSDESVMP